MKNYSIKISLFILATITSGSVDARRMEKVLIECEKQQPYPEYARCIRERYEKVGNFKKSGPVFAFYSLLREIEEAYVRSAATSTPMSESRARSNVYRAWQSTIEASNVSETGKICAVEGDLLVCR